MSYGIVQYTPDGLPICEFCGKGFHRVLRHVWLKHGVNQRSYKVQFGFDLHKGITSEESAHKSRIKTLEHREQCIDKNLKQGGNATKFKKGNKARSKEKISQQSLLKLKATGRRNGLSHMLSRIDRIIEGD